MFSEKTSDHISKLPGIRTIPGKRVEQGTGIEPASSAWEADVLPMYYPCISDVL